MALKVKDATTSAQKFVSRAQGATQDYVNGAQNSGSLWAAQATAANDTYVAGVTAAAQAGRYKNGVSKAGASSYENGVKSKGAVRYGPGVQQAGPKWQANTSPYLDLYSSLNLPPRAPRGDPRNQQRSTAVQEAAHKKRMGQS